jgi:hypothetical protein
LIRGANCAPFQEMMNRMTLDTPRLPRLILGFWAGWYFVVVASNVCDFVQWLGWLPASWLFASGNLALVRKTTAIYGIPDMVAAALFAAAIVWELAAAVAFSLAVSQQSSCALAWPAAERALLVGIGLWSAFILSDEIFIAYPTGIEGAHLRIFTAHLASLIAIGMLPARERENLER